MKSEKIFARKIESRLAKKQDNMQKQPAVFAQTVIVPNQINFNYVVIGDKTVPVYNDRVPARAGIKIWVGYDAIDSSNGRKLGRFQVLGTRSEDAAGGQSISSSGNKHAKSHEWNAEGGGQDLLHVHQRAITFLRVGVSTIAGNVKLYKGKIWTGTTFMNIPTQNIDLSAQIPSTTGKAAFVMITIDTSGAIVQTKGSEVDIADLAEVDRPDVPADTAYVSACVRVYEGQIKPQEGRVNTDFDDVRFTGWNVAVKSVTGDGVDNTDTANPVISYPTVGDIGAMPDVTTTAEYDVLVGGTGGTAGRWIKKTLSDFVTTLRTLLDYIFVGADGWIPVSDTWVYASATTVTVAGNKTSLYKKGLKVRWTEATSPTTRYGTIKIDSTYSAPNTTITLITNTDFVVGNEALANVYYSRAELPDGWTEWFTFTSAIAAQTGTPTTVTSTAKYKTNGKTMKVVPVIIVTNKGTATNGGFFSVPVTIVVAGTGSGNDSGVNGFQMLCTASAGNTQVFFAFYNNSTPWINNVQANLSVEFGF